MRKIISAGAVLAVVALTAPGADASHATVSCRFRAITGTPVNGSGNYEGTAEGVIAAAESGTVRIRCAIKVDGALTAATDWGSGTATAVTVGPLSFPAPSPSVVHLCAQYDTMHGRAERCFAVGFPDVLDAGGVFDLGGPRAWCGRVRWADGDQCAFEAPAGAFTVAGTAENPGGLAHIKIEVSVLGLPIGGCEAVAQNVATCWSDVVVSPFPHTPHTCLVRGTGGTHFQCADPPPLPVAP